MVPVASLVGIPSPFTPVQKIYELGAAIVAVNGDGLVAQVGDVVINLAHRADDLLPVELVALAFEGHASRIPAGSVEALPDVAAARHAASAPAVLLVVDLVAIA